MEIFKNLYNEHQSYVRKTLFYMVGEGPLDDLVQEVFIKIWKNMAQFKGNSTSKTWIYRITMNTAYDFFRKNKKAFVEIEKVELVDDKNAEKDLVIKELIRKGILELPIKQRSAFVLYYKEELSVAEISESLKISAGTVKSRLHHARGQFTDFLNKHGVHYE